jgi:hypothetical protein
MKEQFLQLHNDMLTEINSCMKSDLPETEKVESCFWIASEYWDLLKKKLAEIRFKNDNEEIDFFRNVKPQFTGYIEYFTILAQAILFLPMQKQELMAYWEYETQRYKRFYDRNEDFIKYYESGLNYMDSNYFLKASNDLNYIPNATIYDVDTAFSTSHDHLIRSLFANKMYYEFALKRLEELKKENTK